MKMGAQEFLSLFVLALAISLCSQLRNMIAWHRARMPLGVAMRNVMIGTSIVLPWLLFLIVMCWYGGSEWR